MIAHRHGEKNTISAAARFYDDLADVLVPLISQSGFDALIGRALQLTQREYAASADSAAESETAGSDRVREWLELLEEREALEAAAAFFSELAALLSTLIGESLTTRYLVKAWPDDFNDAAGKGRK